MFCLTLSSSVDDSDHNTMPSHLKDFPGSDLAFDQPQTSAEQWPFGRKLQISTWRNLRYRLDYTLSKPLDAETDFYLKRVIINPVLIKLRQMIRVTGPTLIPRFNRTICTNEAETDAFYKNNNVDTDLILFIKVETIPDNVIAFAGTCMYSQVNKRPLAGLVIINSNYIVKQYSAIEVLKGAILHEILHVMAFNNRLFDIFPVGKDRTYVKEIRVTATGSRPVYRIILPGLVQFGKRYFGCSNFSGLIMENEGTNSADSHFEQTLYQGEIMTAISNGIPILSHFTLYFLGSCGWYQVNYNYAQEYNWGRKKGCDFVNTQCDTRYPEYCSSEYQVKCSNNRRRKVVCQKSSFTDNCIMSTDFDTLNCANTNQFKRSTDLEVPGRDSYCFDMSYFGMSGPGCFQAFCETGRIRVQVMDKSYYCDSVTKGFSIGILSIKCPTFDEICKPAITDSFEYVPCPGGCSGNGICLIQRGVCECYTFYTGVNCEIYTGCGFDKTLCDKIIPASIKTT
jgi:hypothetical protein